MPGTYSQLLLHIVFSTKYRTRWITADVAERLYPYLGGIVRAEKGILFDVGGVEDHVHLYLRWRTDAAISDLMRTVGPFVEVGARHVPRPGRVRLAGGVRRLHREQVAGADAEAVHRAAG
jgi:hypothetical protein